MTAPSRPLFWAQAIVAHSAALVAQGMHPRRAWCIAAGVEDIEIPEVTAQDAAVAWVTAQAEPVTSAQVGEELGIPGNEAASTLRTAERRGLLVMAGTIRVDNHHRILWKAP